MKKRIDNGEVWLLTTLQSVLYSLNVNLIDFTRYTWWRASESLESSKWSSIRTENVFSICEKRSIRKEKTKQKAESRKIQRKQLGWSGMHKAVFVQINCAHHAASLLFPFSPTWERKRFEIPRISYQFYHTDITIVSCRMFAKVVLEFFDQKIFMILTCILFSQYLL